MLIGSSFKSSPIEFRERLLGEFSKGSESWHRLDGVRESAMLQTCNRLELCFASQDPAKTEAGFFSRLPEGLRNRDSFYVLRGSEALVHLFELASGLDSMVVGEDQILSQLRDAGRAARVSGRSRAILSTLFDISVGVGARVRSLQTIPPESSSVSSFALKFALQKLGRRPEGVMLIGTGKVMKLAASELEGCRIYVATKRREVSAHFSTASKVSYHEIGGVAKRCDLIISATKHPDYVIKEEEVPDDRRRVILDLAFPRNIDPALRRSRNIELYDLDDLASAAARQSSDADELKLRWRPVIQEEASRFGRWLTASRLSPSLSNLYRWAESVRDTETELALRRLAGLSPREKRVIEAMSRRLISKLLAPAAAFAKGSTEGLSQKERLAILDEMFAAGGGGP